MKQHNKKGRCLSMLLGNFLSGKGTVRAGEGMLRADYGSSIKKKL